MYKRKKTLKNTENTLPKIKKVNITPEGNCCNCAELREFFQAELNNMKGKYINKYVYNFCLVTF